MSTREATMAISEAAYLGFARDLAIPFLTEPRLNLFNSNNWTEACVEMARTALSEETSFLSRALEADGPGIAVIDIPESHLLTPAQNTLAGVAAVVGLFGFIGTPAGNLIGDLPFTLHRASHSQNSKMKDIGLSNFTPDAKLGFHNDGNISGTHAELPLHISIYNLLISYRQPGNFSWVPLKEWSESKHFEKYAGMRSQADIRLTPTVHFDNNGKPVRTGVEKITTPLIFRNQLGQMRFFMNGDAHESENSAEIRSLFLSLKESISKAHCIDIAQKERRAIFMNNAQGFHARDIFEDPIPDVDLSRVFLRLVDQHAEICVI
jgi:hypothetical protein